MFLSFFIFKSKFHKLSQKINLENMRSQFFLNLLLQCHYCIYNNAIIADVYYKARRFNDTILQLQYPNILFHRQCQCPVFLTDQPGNPTCLLTEKHCMHASKLVQACPLQHWSNKSTFSDLFHRREKPVNNEILNQYFSVRL